MPLNKDTLRQSIKAAFKKAQDTPPLPTKPPPTEEEIKQLQEQILTTLSDDLANAINTFVASGEVTGVTVQVNNFSNVPIGNGVQNNLVKVH